MTPPERTRGGGRRKLHPHQRIMRAAKRCTGLRLTADEVWMLSRDDAIMTAACNMDEDDAEAASPER